jgi:hypothetical protein
MIVFPRVHGATASSVLAACHVSPSGPTTPPCSHTGLPPPLIFPSFFFSPLLLPDTTTVPPGKIGRRAAKIPMRLVGHLDECRASSCCTPQTMAVRCRHASGSKNRRVETQLRPPQPAKTATASTSSIAPPRSSRAATVACIRSLSLPSGRACRPPARSAAASASR